MFFVVAGFSIVAGVSVRGLIKRHSAAEIAAFALVMLAALYFALMLAWDKEAWSPLGELLKWLEGSVGLSYDKLLSGTTTK